MKMLCSHLRSNEWMTYEPTILQDGGGMNLYLQNYMGGIFVVTNAKKLKELVERDK